MGKKKTTTKPVYESQITGAANTVTNAYNQNAGSIQAGADQFASVLPSILDRYKNGDPTNNAARAHYDDVLSGKYLTGNPYLQDIIDTTNSSVLNSRQAALGTRGLTGGSDYMKLAAQALAENESGLRYDDYNRQSDRMDNAAASVGNLTSADGNILNQALAAYQAQTAPLLAAQDYGSTIGGLLGQYTKTKQSSGIGGVLGGLAGSALSSWAAGGFRGV